MIRRLAKNSYSVAQSRAFTTKLQQKAFMDGHKAISATITPSQPPSSMAAIRHDIIQNGVLRRMSLLLSKEQKEEEKQEK
jgi:hypothetical protein